MADARVLGAGEARRTADWDVCGIVGVRALDASPADVAAVARQLGAPAARPLQRAPDVVVRFVDRIATRGAVRRLGDGRSGIADGTYLLLSPERDGHPIARVPFASLGGAFTMECERGLRGGVPLLVPLVNATALDRGWVPLHASAFVRDGVGVLTAGRAHGGKTATLLAFMAHGATYVGDDWVYLSADGASVRGLDQEVGVRGSYLQQLPELRARLDRARPVATRARMRALELMQRVEHAVPDQRGRATTTTGFRHRVRAALEWRLSAHVAAGALFGASSCADAGPLDVVLLADVHDAPDVRVRAADAGEAAGELARGLEHEWGELLLHYRAFRSALPGEGSRVLEEREARRDAVLSRAMAGRSAYVVSHPSPASLARLHDAVSPLLTRRA